MAHKFKMNASHWSGYTIEKAVSTPIICPSIYPVSVNLKVRCTNTETVNVREIVNVGR